jgi:hypothetical protein
MPERPHPNPAARMVSESGSLVGLLRLASLIDVVCVCACVRVCVVSRIESDVTAGLGHGRRRRPPHASLQRVRRVVLPGKEEASLQVTPPLSSSLSCLSSLG